jgi:hypothetical protein
MDPIEFAKLVAELRERQKEYFRTKSTGALEASKVLERKVDRALKEILAPPGLF